jgi:hypothetical protein
MSHSTSYRLGNSILRLGNFALVVYSQITTSDSSTTTSTPIVTTSAVTYIGIYDASVSGNVTSDGSIALTYRGICISTNTTPTVSDTSIRDTNTGEGVYTLNMTSLDASTLYYIRAFAYNSQGTAYGDNTSFYTLSADSSTTQYVYFTEDSSIFRKGVRDNAFVVDAALTPTGFSGTENIDWENLKYVQH